jgi:hypothetical protein
MTKVSSVREGPAPAANKQHNKTPSFFHSSRDGRLYSTTIQVHFYFYHEDEGGTVAAAAPAAFLASNLPLQALRDARVFF